MPTKKATHGGRRHGLAPAGESHRIKVGLTPDGHSKLQRLAAARTRFADHRVSLAEAVRALIDEAPEPPEETT